MAVTTKFVSTPSTPAEQLICEIGNLYLSQLRAFANGSMSPEIIADTVSELTNIFNSGKVLYTKENIDLAKLHDVVGRLKYYQPPKFIMFSITSELQS